MNSQKYFTALVFLGLSACSTFSKKTGSTELLIQQPSFVKVSGETEKKVQAGESIEIKSYPVLVESPGFMGLLITKSPDGGTQKLEVSLRPLDSWSGDVFEKKVATQVTEIVSTVNEVQVLLSNQKYDEALGKINEIEKRFPSIRWLGFLRASVLTSLGNLGEAKLVLESTLKVFPSDRDGLKLKEILNGRSPASEGAP